MGCTRYKLGNYNESLKDFEESRKIYEKINLFDKEYNYPLWLAKCYKSIDDLEKLSQTINRYKL